MNIILVNQVIGYMWSICIALWLMMKEVNMEFWKMLLISAIPALITGVVTYIVSKNSQIRKNTDVIETMMRQLGLRDDMTLRTEVNKHYNDIKNDIGRGENGSLSYQHEYILGEINKNYLEIKNRYNKQDEAYRSFTAEQYDLKQTLDNFSRNYMEVINSERKLYVENLKLKDENKALKNKVTQLSHELNNQRSYSERSR